MQTSTTTKTMPKSEKDQIRVPNLKKTFLDSLPRWLTIEQAAEIVGLNPRQMRCYVAEGRILGVMRIGKSWAVPKERAIRFAKKPRPVGRASWKNPVAAEKRRIRALKRAMREKYDE